MHRAASRRLASSVASHLDAPPLFAGRRIVQRWAAQPSAPQRTDRRSAWLGAFRTAPHRPSLRPASPRTPSHRADHRLASRIRATHPEVSRRAATRRPPPRQASSRTARPRPVLRQAPLVVEGFASRRPPPRAVPLRSATFRVASPRPPHGSARRVSSPPRRALRFSRLGSASLGPVHRKATRRIVSRRGVRRHAPQGVASPPEVSHRGSPH